MGGVQHPHSTGRLRPAAVTRRASLPLHRQALHGVDDHVAVGPLVRDDHGPFLAPVEPERAERDERRAPRPARAAG